MTLQLTTYQRVVTDPADIPEGIAFKGLFLELLTALDLELICEETPDYKALEIRKKGSA